jgi:hypothetical protein
MRRLSSLLALSAMLLALLALLLGLGSPEASQELQERPSIMAHDLGDDPMLDRLWMACSTWNMDACDELETLAGPLSEYRALALEMLEEGDR